MAAPGFLLAALSVPRVRGDEPLAARVNFSSKGNAHQAQSAHKVRSGSLIDLVDVRKDLDSGVLKLLEGTL